MEKRGDFGDVNSRQIRSPALRERKEGREQRVTRQKQTAGREGRLGQQKVRRRPD